MTIEQIYKLFLRYPVVETDSRKISENCFFFALKGGNFDGNKFAAEALKKGAALAVIDDENYQIPGKTVVVKNTLKALQDLANMHRKKMALPILGITGTNGKTTTKELIAMVLSKKFNTNYTRGNLNNHIGVPLTLLRMNSKTEFCIVEMGANHPGEIAELCRIADPDFGIITNIGKAHLEGFGSFDGVKKTKAELYHHVNAKGGTIFYHKSNEILSELVQSVDNTFSYGKKDADFTGEPVPSPPFVHIKAHFPKGMLYLNTQLTGDYNFENVLAAAAIGFYFKVEPLKIQQALKEYQPSNNRSQLITKKRIKIIMDAYNANPTSMKASINSFVSSFSNDRYLILGDMLELGEFAIQEHKNMLDEISRFQFNGVYLIGPVFADIAKNHPFPSFEDVDDFYRFLKINPIRKGAILIKGSRGIQLEKVLDFL